MTLQHKRPRASGSKHLEWYVVVFRSQHGPTERQSCQATLLSFLDTLRLVELSIAIPAGPGIAAAQLAESDSVNSTGVRSRTMDRASNLFLSTVDGRRPGAGLGPTQALQQRCLRQRSPTASASVTLFSLT